MYYIHAPIGGFGNHTRLLLLLSNKFLMVLDDNTFIDSIDRKIIAIENKIYPKEKTWHNWLAMEWQFRNYLSNSIVFSHGIEACLSDKDEKSRFIGLNVNPKLCHRCYLKMNNNLNKASYEGFIADQEKSNKLYKIFSKSDSRFLNFNADALFNPVLDKEIYYRMIEWFGADDKYEHAAKVHNIWYNLQIKAEREFVEYVNNLYN